MNIEEIKELMDALAERDIAELEIQRGEERIRIRRTSPAEGANQPPYVIVTPGSAVAEGAATPAVLPASNQPPSTASSAPTVEPETAEAKEEEADLTTITAPIVGTFYAARSPGEDPFVQVGDEVRAGQVLCVIEAMKLMNEIEAETAGTIVKQHAANAQPVEYGEPLFAIRPSA